MKLTKLPDIRNFIENEVMPNQFKYVMYIVLGVIGILVLAWWWD